LIFYRPSCGVQSCVIAFVLVVGSIARENENTVPAGRAPQSGNFNRLMECITDQNTA
jgi:hypothetical protein